MTGTKRTADEKGGTSISASRQPSKRLKRSTFTSEDTDSSAPSSGSISEDSALQSSPERSKSTIKTDLSPTRSQTSNEESQSSDLESEHDSESNDETIITIGGPKKPQMAQGQVTEGSYDLRSRLNAFLPELAASNQLLGSVETGISMEDVKDGEEYIEMNLGLGVLEQRGSQNSSRHEDASDSSESDSNTDKEDSPPSSSTKRPAGNHESHIMENLLGQTQGRPKPGIEDMG